MQYAVFCIACYIVCVIETEDTTAKLCRWVHSGNFLGLCVLCFACYVRGMKVTSSNLLQHTLLFVTFTKWMGRRGVSGITSVMNWCCMCHVILIAHLCVRLALEYDRLWCARFCLDMFIIMCNRFRISIWCTFCYLFLRSLYTMDLLNSRNSGDLPNLSVSCFCML